MDKSYTPVVVGLICQNGKVLIVRAQEETLKRDRQSVAGYWEFPGGKVKWGEVPQDALKRELKEELNITAEIDKLKIAHTHIYSLNHALLLLFYKVVSWQSEIKNLYHTDLKWVEISQISNYQLLPANVAILPQLLDALLET